MSLKNIIPPKTSNTSCIKEIQYTYVKNEKSKDDAWLNSFNTRYNGMLNNCIRKSI